jgi:hypothetical protein
MSYVLATTGIKVKWYKFKYRPDIKEGDFELLDELDLSVVPEFDDKRSANMAARALGLSTWRYVQFK